MSEAQAQPIIFEIVMKEEKCVERRNKIVEEMRKTFNAMPVGLDQKHRDIFN